jgi:IPT/TIG domain
MREHIQAISRTTGRARGRSARTLIGRVAIAAAMAVTGLAAVYALPAGAVVGGSATADSVDVSLVVAQPPLTISAVGGTADVTAPATNGSNSSGASASVVSDAVFASATTAVVNSVATRGATSMSASSDLNSTAVTFFGDSVVSAGVIASDVACPLVGSRTASASAATVTIGTGPPVTLSTSGTASATGTASVTHPFFVGGTATVAVTATTEASTTATTASAVGLRLTFSIASGTLVAGSTNVAGTALGSVVLAETSCSSPTGPDPAPSSILTIVPDNGPTTGGTATTLTGSGFTGATGVTFDGVAGTGFTVVNDTTITVTTPPGAAGPADVVVLDALGNGTLPGGFTYTAVPAAAPSSIVSVSPASGPTTGGTTVTITGSGFTGATGVTFDGVAATGFTVVNDTTITVTTPLGAAGPADVVVLDAAGNGTRPGGFTYISATTVTALPRTGTDILTMLAAGIIFLVLGLTCLRLAPLSRSVRRRQG